MEPLRFLGRSILLIFEKLMNRSALRLADDVAGRMPISKLALLCVELKLLLFRWMG